MKVTPPLEALGMYLPKAKAEADSVILLYYGSIGGLSAASEKHGRALGLGGCPQDNLLEAEVVHDRISGR